jgi:predicted TIM-barrel fold metal-dependent hydrolase
MLYEGPRIDSDVHHNWRRDDAVIDYLPARWSEYVRAPERSRSLYPPAIFNPAPNGISNRLDAFPDDGPAGSDLDLMRRQLLEPFNISHAIVSFDVGPNPGVSNLEFATELTRAINRWSIDHWLSGQDDRIYGSLLLNTQLPEEAARDIRELGRHPRIGEALFVANGAGKPLGHPVYDPIYAAAAEIGLPVAIHIGGDTFLTGATTHTAAGGLPTTRFERHSLQMQPVQHYLASLLVHGVFEKFADLRLIVKETGIAWVPWFFWELDAAEPILRRESSWIRRRPSDYFRKHMRLTTQPLEEPARFDQLVDLLEALGGMEDLLCFSTDYPHHDTDDPDHVARRLPERWWEKVFYANALAAYGWPDTGRQRARPGARGRAR